MPTTTTENVFRNCRLQWTGKIPPDLLGKLQGAKVNVDETSGRQSLRDRIGSVRDVTLQDGIFRATFILNPAHEIAAQVAYDAKHFPQTVVLKIVKSAGDRYAVALVASGEASNGNGLYESTDGPGAAAPPSIDHQAPHNFRLLPPAQRVAAVVEWRRRMKRFTDTALAEFPAVAQPTPLQEGEFPVGLIREFQKAKARGLSDTEARQLAERITESMDSDRHTATWPTAVLQESGISRFLDQHSKARYRKVGGRVIQEDGSNLALRIRRFTHGARESILERVPAGTLQEERYAPAIPPATAPLRKRLARFAR